MNKLKETLKNSWITLTTMFIILELILFFYKNFNKWNFQLSTLFIMVLIIIFFNYFYHKEKK